MKKLIIILLILLTRGFGGVKDAKNIIMGKDNRAVAAVSDTVTIKYGTFLGNEKRRFYGRGPVPEKLDVLWKMKLGTGRSEIKGKKLSWTGWGWTGQPALVEEGGRDYLIAGSYSHKLRKIDAETGNIVWEYEFSDIIKASPAVLKDKNGRTVILCGSRGTLKGAGDSDVYSFRCLSLSGKELWQLSTEKTESLSRDVDGTCLYDSESGRIYIGAENGIFYIIDPAVSGSREMKNRVRIIRKIPLYEKEDVKSHRGDIYIESSPALSGDIIYITSGSGHIYGINRDTLKVVWDFRTGSDINGTAPVSNEGCLFVAVEKQYIPGNGGALKLDPAKDPKDAVEWFFPTGNKKFADWQGGIIGSVAINDEYNTYPERMLAAFSGIDGFLYVVSQDELEKNRYSWFNKTRCSVPKLVYKKNIGGSISTPVFVDNYIIACGYDCRLHVFRIDYGKKIRLKETAVFRAGMIESTPLVWDNRIYISSRDGYLYCLGPRN